MAFSNKTMNPLLQELRNTPLLVASLDGKNIIRDSVSAPEAQAESMGIQLAERLLSKGADRLLDELLSAI